MATLYLTNGSLIHVSETREECVNAKSENGLTFDFTVGRQTLSVFSGGVVAVLDNYPKD